MPHVPPPEINTSAFCPPESAIASPQTFRNKVRIAKGETAFQTVKKFRIAENKKNGDGDRLYRTYEACRQANSDAIQKLKDHLDAREKQAQNNGVIMRE